MPQQELASETVVEWTDNEIWRENLVLRKSLWQKNQSKRAFCLWHNVTDSEWSRITYKCVSDAWWNCSRRWGHWGNPNKNALTTEKISNRWKWINTYEPHHIKYIHNFESMADPDNFTFRLCSCDKISSGKWRAAQIQYTHIFILSISKK